MKNFRYSQRVLFAPAAALVCSLYWAGIANAQEHGLEENEISLFVGLAHEGRDDGPAIGIEYERRIDESLGLGVLVQKTFGDFDTWVFALPLTLHVEEWKFILAPGIEDQDGGSENLVRIAVGYEFETSKGNITPIFNVDFVDDEAIFVLGVSFGWPF